MKSRKAYESPTRKEHAELTRQKIVQALMDLMVDERPATVSIPAVAKRANVSVRTVYHYFPTKDALFDALPGATRNRGDVDVPTPKSPKELAAAAPAVFAYFEHNTALFNAMRVSEASERVTTELDRLAVERARGIVSPLLDDLDEEQLQRLGAVLSALVSYDTYRSLTRRYGLSREDAATTVAWAVNVLADRVKRTRRVGDD